MRSLFVLLALTPIVLGVLGPGASDASAAPAARWIDVSVATLWVQPAIARPLDAPSLGDPVHPRAWVEGMTVEQKRWLVGKLETQALYGTKVYLLGTQGTWSHVAVPSQPTPRSTWGYPGWVPSVQLTDRAPEHTASIAVVRRPSTRLCTTASFTVGVMPLSYGTRLRVHATTSTAVEVVLLNGRHGFVRRSAVALQRVDGAWPTLTGDRLVAEARRFLRLQYLWAGTSGFAYDCSGLTYSVYQALGRTLPRDADGQFQRGVKIAARSSLRRGDLVFFRNASGIHHVGMYVGDGRMIHAPRTGEPVQITSLQTQPYAGEFAGGRRFAP